MFQSVKGLIKSEIYRMMEHAILGLNGKMALTGVEQYVRELQAIDRLEHFVAGFAHGNDSKSVTFSVDKAVMSADIRRVTIDTRNTIEARCVVEVDMPVARKTMTMKVVDLVALLELGRL